MMMMMMMMMPFLRDLFVRDLRSMVLKVWGTRKRLAERGPHGHRWPPEMGDILHPYTDKEG